MIVLANKLSSFDVSVIICGHHEGLSCIPSIRSAYAAAQQARLSKISVELIFALDCGDSITREIVVKNLEEGIIDKILHLDVDDLGQCRNCAVRESSGEWIAFIDADDLWSPNWLTLAFRSAQLDRRQIVWHPELNIYFGERLTIMRHLDMEDPLFDSYRLGFQNFWTSSVFARRSFFQVVQYPATDLANQLGYEDWSWNVRVVEKGAFHKVAAGTTHGIRVKSRSLVRRTAEYYAMPEPTHFFRTVFSSAS